MKRHNSSGLITIFTPSFADADNTNAQNLTAKEIVARLSPDLFRVVMICAGLPDPRIATRKNTVLLPYRKHGNTPHLLVRALSHVPDIYFFPREGPLDSALFFLRKLLKLRTAVVTYAVSGGLDREPPTAARMRNICEADALVGNSLYLSELLRQRFKIEASTIYDGVDKRRFYPRNEGATTTPTTVLYAGSFQPYKRAQLVVREAVKRPDVAFRLAGTGGEDQSCRRLAEQLGCRNVEFLGVLTQQQLGEEMRRADVFFFPSILEGHPQVLLQAAGCGLPAVAMDHYRPEYVINGATGFLASSDEELSETLNRLLDNPQLRRRMSDAALRHSCRFDWEQIADQWANIFQQVMMKRHRDLAVEHKRLEYS